MENSMDHVDLRLQDDSWWKKHLDPRRYAVLRKCETEPPFSGQYWNNDKTGIYVCAGCGETLFLSSDKYDSGCGWPSFTRPADTKAVSTRADTAHGLERTEVVCARCGGHLGHIFDDGPRPSGKRFCVNSESLDFKLERGVRAKERPEKKSVIR